MIRQVATLCCVLSGASIAACASVADLPPGPPNYAVIITRSESRAALYADCIAAATATGDYAVGQEGDSTLILFTCHGAPARAFYDGLATRSAAIGSEVVTQGRTLRSTDLVQRDLFGVDYCSTDGAGEYDCTISLNAGEFLAGAAD